MIPAPFSYRRADSVAEALDLASEFGDDAKFLAGGHSLLPLMKLRLALPEVLIDLGPVRELSYIRAEDGHIAIGALTRHHDLEHSEVMARSVPLLAHAAGQVGDPQVRHRGTIGGSLAHSDPASDLPATVLALDATLVARGPAGSREIPAAEFFQGLFETVLEPDELLTEIRVPVPGPDAAGWSFQKFTKRAIDWAIVGGRGAGPRGRPGEHGGHAGAGGRGGARAGRRGSARRSRRARRGRHEPGRRHQRQSGLS